MKKIWYNSSRAIAKQRRDGRYMFSRVCSVGYAPIPGVVFWWAYRTDQKCRGCRNRVRTEPYRNVRYRVLKSYRTLPKTSVKCLPRKITSGILQYVPYRPHPWNNTFMFYPCRRGAVSPFPGGIGRFPMPCEAFLSARRGIAPGRTRTTPRGTEGTAPPV